MGEVAGGDGVRELGQIAEEIAEHAARLPCVPAAAEAGEFARVEQAEACDTFDEQAMAGAKQCAFFFSREALEVFHELEELEEQRTRVRIIESGN